MGQTVGYARVSTTGQSLEIQLKQLAAEGCTKIFQEKISGAKRDRPQLAAMLEYCRAGDTLTVCRLDRVARSTKDLLDIVEALEAKGVAFRVLNINLDTSTPTGKLMLTMLGAIATFEREMMLERQADGIARAKAEGRFNGRPATAKNKSAQVIELISQGMTKQAVANELNIGVASVYRILKDKKTIED